MQLARETPLAWSVLAELLPQSSSKLQQSTLEASGTLVLDKIAPPKSHQDRIQLDLTLGIFMNKLLPFS